MENLTLEDQPPQQGGGPTSGQSLMGLLGGGQPQQNPQLPPQMFTTAAQLLDMTDSKYRWLLFKPLRHGCEFE